MNNFYESIRKNKAKQKTQQQKKWTKTVMGTSQMMISK